MAGADSSSNNDKMSLDTSKDCRNFISKLGSVIRCTDALGKVHEGEVLAYDVSANLVILKIPSSSRKANLSNIILVKPRHQDNITLIREPLRQSLSGESLPNLDTEKLDLRRNQNIQEKMRKVELIRKGASPIAQDLICAISKTISEVGWENENIVVMNKVAIRPPYQVDNCFEIEPNHQLLTFVSKMVDKFHKERRTNTNRAF